MNSKIAVAVGLAAVLAAMAVTPASFSPAFAANVAASITSGAQSKTTDAFSPYPITASVGDTVTWTNDDTTVHTVTSGENSGDPNAGKVFDSSPGLKTLLAPKQTFSHTFTEAGDFPYFCQLHPSMKGLVKVAAAGGGNTGGQPIPSKITAKTADGKSFDVTSTSTTSTLTDVKINEGKSVTLTFDKAGDVEVTLPKALISGNLSVMAGGNPVQSTPTDGSDSTTLKFTLPAGTTSVDITGTSVVPEFPLIAALILAGSIAAITGYARFAKNNNSGGIGFPRV